MSRLLAIAALLAALAVACGGDGATPAPGATSPAAAETKPSAEPTATPPAGASEANVEPVSFETKDGLRIDGQLYTTPGPKRKAVILAASFLRPKGWEPLARDLAARGIAALTFTMPRYVDTGESRDLALADDDMETAVRFLQSRDYPLIYLAGEFEAGTVALRVAARLDLAGVVTASARISSTSGSTIVFDARQDVVSVTEPKLFLAGQDSLSPAVVDTLMQLAPQPKQSWVADSPAMGSQIIEIPEARRLIIDFISR